VRRFEQSRRLSGLVLEKIPLLALAGGACAMTVLGAEKEVAGYANVSTLSRMGKWVGFLCCVISARWLAGRAGGFLSPAGESHPVWTMRFLPLTGVDYLGSFGLSAEARAGF